MAAVGGGGGAIEDPKIFQLSFYFKEYTHENVSEKEVTKSTYNYIPKQKRESYFFPLEILIKNVCPKLPLGIILVKTYL